MGLDKLSPARWNVSDVALATVLVIVGFFVTMGLPSVATSVVGADDPSHMVIWAIGALEGLMILAVWIFAVRRYSVGWGALGLRLPRAKRSFLLPGPVLLGSLGFSAVYVAVITWLGLELLEPPDIQENLLGSGLIRFANSIMLVIWGPFAEEVFFRGFMLSAFVQSVGAIRAVAIGSLVFAVAHVSPGAMVPIFVAGLLLSWLYLKTGSIWPPFIAHALQNLIAVSMVY